MEVEPVNHLQRPEVRLLGALVVVLLLLVLGYDGSVPLLALADLGFHELGHMLTYWMPEVATAAMGSIVQVLVPFGLASYFYVRDELASVAVLLGWMGTSMRNVAVYIADAPFERLQLIGGDHDWAFIFFKYDKLDWAVPLGGLFGFFGLMVTAGAAAWCGYLLYQEISSAQLSAPQEGGAG